MTVRLPTDAEIRELDDALAAKGVPANKRHDRALWLWTQKVGGFPLEFAVTARWFREKFAALHPSVNFSDQPFAYLCVSARGVCYELRPPVVVGSCAIDPAKCVRIQQAELERIYTADPRAFWELYYQAADGIDLFMSHLDFHPRSPESARMLAVGTDQLEASARQLVACSQDASLSQACCLAVETVLKAVLLEKSTATPNLKGIGHNTMKLCAAVASVVAGPNDKDFAAVAASIPKYVDVRYNPPQLTTNEAQDLYRRTLFLCAEALRRTRHDQLYYKIAADPQVPARDW
jgi:hypothetical protein